MKLVFRCEKVFLEVWKKSSYIFANIAVQRPRRRMENSHGKSNQITGEHITEWNTQITTKIRGTVLQYLKSSFRDKKTEPNNNLNSPKIGKVISGRKRNWSEVMKHTTKSSSRRDVCSSFPAKKSVRPIEDSSKVSFKALSSCPSRPLEYFDNK